MKASVLGQFKNGCRESSAKGAEGGYEERVASVTTKIVPHRKQKRQQWQETLPFDREKPQAGPCSFGGWRLEQTD